MRPIFIVGVPVSAGIESVLPHLEEKLKNENIIILAHYTSERDFTFKLFTEHGEMTFEELLDKLKEEVGDIFTKVEDTDLEDTIKSSPKDAKKYEEAIREWERSKSLSWRPVKILEDLDRTFRKGMNAKFRINSERGDFELMLGEGFNKKEFGFAYAGYIQLI